MLFISPDVTQFLKLAEGSNNLTTIEIVTMINFMQMITANVMYMLWFNFILGFNFVLGNVNV